MATSFLPRLLLVVSASFVLGELGQALAVLSPESYVAVRVLPGPNDRHTQSGGISNAGDVIGREVAEWDVDHNNHSEAMVRWLRDTGYSGEVVSGGLKHANPEAGDVVVPGESYHGIHVGAIRDNTPHVSMSHTGFVHGTYTVNNWHGFRYDIRNDVLTDLGIGMISDGNTQGLVVGTYSTCCGAHGNGYYSKLLDINAEGLDKKYEVFNWYPKFFDDVFPWAINDHNVIVGNVGSIFMPNSKPAKLLPTGENTWGEPIEMEALDEEEASTEGGFRGVTSNVFAISESEDRPFGAGNSGSPGRGAVWDINSGKIVADFGALTEAYGISANGKYVIGLRKQFSIPPQTDPMVWVSEDNWESYEEINLNDDVLGALKPPQGAELWDSFLEASGINDDGMVVGQGNPSLFAIAEGIVTTYPFGTAVFLLDTKELDLESVLLGDVNNDGAIDNLDITPFITALASEDEAAFLVDFPQGSYSAADVDTSGSPDNLDITPFISLLTGQGSGSAVPEPASLALLAAGALMAVRRGRRA